MMGLVRRGLAAFAGGGGSSLVEDLALAGMRVAELLTRYVHTLDVVGWVLRTCAAHPLLPPPPMQRPGTHPHLLSGWTDHAGDSDVL